MENNRTNKEIDKLKSEHPIPIGMLSSNYSKLVFKNF